MHIDGKSGISYTGKANNRLRKKQKEVENGCSGNRCARAEHKGRRLQKT